MFAFRSGLRAASRAVRGGSSSFTRTRTTPFNSKRIPQFQPRRPASRYSRFGEKPRDSQQQSQQQRQQRQQQWSNFGPVYRAQYIWRSYKTPLLVTGAGGGTLYYINLEEVPISGRRRFNILSPEKEKEFFGGSEMYNSVLQEFRGKILPADHPLTVTVANVVERLLPTVGSLAGDDWRVHVIDDPNTMNAFVMPGGKVFVFSGILPTCQDENGLAAVLGHEIAHNVAHHAAERISRSGFIMLSAFLVSFIFDVSGQIGNSISEIILSLPNSRTQESEADHIGLLMMAQACYDPQAALDFWERMRQTERRAPPQFLNTHPSSYNRAEEIRKWLPEAQRIYQDTGCSMDTRQHAIVFNKALDNKVPPSKAKTPKPTVIRRRRNDDDDDFF